ncbi:uncharacterized protein ACNLHF_018127 isoform 2-T2 [Anomaloglossus baeobatrachus]|uniref:uncharacterized protein LOC142309916 isoform X2 n=1 Tax=Anomaloglossus baeobatrachus TaxID=238106 RepID=UPI003F503042
MSVQMNEATTRNQVHYAPPEYNDIPGIQMWNGITVPPAAPPVNECTQPPAYDTIFDVPIWTTPLPDSDRSFSTQHWNTDSQIPLHDVISSSQYQRSNPVTSQASETPLFYYKVWKSPPAIVGVLILVASFLQVFTGTVLASSRIAVISKTLTYGIPFWAGVCIRISLIFNILTTIISSVGLTFNVIDLEKLWNLVYPQYSINEYKIYYILISTNVALLCLSISAGIFGFCILCHSSRKDPQESVTENGFISPMAPSDLPQLQLSSPPPYTPQGITL